MVNDESVLFPHGGFDVHHHIFDPHQFPYAADRHLTPPPATLEKFEKFKASLGITNSVLVHGLSYGDDCTSLKFFLDALGKEKTRGVAVVDLSTSQAEMNDLHSHGVRGIRLNLYRHQAMHDLSKQMDMLRRYAEKVQDYKWSIAMLQLNPDHWQPLGGVIRELSVPVVADHCALLKAKSMLPEGVDVLKQPGLDAIVSLLKSGNFWVKLSAPYRLSEEGPHYQDMQDVVRTLVQANPRRVLWGSDWPHTPRMKIRSHEEALKETPFLEVDDRQWLLSLRSWLSSEEWHYLMVENPKDLFWW